jgi:cytochrome P450
VLLLPQGTKLWLNLRMVLDDPQWVEGGAEDPRTFNPDRWLNDATARIGWLAFGGGPRMCLGYPFATAELKVGTQLIPCWDRHLGECTLCVALEYACCCSGGVV